ncbi:sensor histidine kinase [Paenibacillus albidus]|uniref:sensor histidine kinase n=1 Tax=Paenibacillus albidus TaxID=2041023 RepID=UPI001BEAA40D|nr:histidine kinase [Paenibacillus albidus]MBT2291573.1 sensor histidine kinase [Paenibacillus albidus]
MTRELTLLRYGLIIVPAAVTIYIYPYDNLGLYTLHWLLLMLLATLNRQLPGPLHPLLSGIEVLFTAWLCHQYGFLMIFPAISALLFYALLRPKALSAIYTCAHLLALNLALQHLEPLGRASLNLTFLLAVFLFHLLHKASRGQEQLLEVYDELRKKHFELEETRVRLLQFTAQVENAAESKERVRIARQLHDDIGHRLIRIKMMMEAAIHTLPSAPETGMLLMGQIRDQLAASMDDMRAAVRRINYAPQLEGAYALDRLLEETGRDTGIMTSYKVEGLPFALYPSVQVVLYKNAREAITNALRHGQASEVQILVRYTEGEVTMEVSNNGRQPEGEEWSRLQASGGMGLTGMTERTRIIGGTLAVRLEPQFTMVTQLPVYQPAARTLS